MSRQSSNVPVLMLLVLTSCFGLASSAPAALRPCAAFDAPVPLSRPMPAYPPLALAKNVSGTVLIDVTVATAGQVTDAAIVSGPALLREPARRSALQWRFHPVTDGGGIHSLRLTFIFHERGYHAPDQQPEFTCPYQLEIVAPVQDASRAQHNKSFERTAR